MSEGPRGGKLICTVAQLIGCGAHPDSAPEHGSVTRSNLRITSVTILLTRVWRPSARGTQPRDLLAGRTAPIQSRDIVNTARRPGYLPHHYDEPTTAGIVNAKSAGMGKEQRANRKLTMGSYRRSLFMRRGL